MMPDLFKRFRAKQSVAESKSFDLSDSSLPGAIERWKKVDEQVQDLIILGLEVTIRDISKEKPNGTLSKKLGALVAARDVLWASK